MERMARLHKAEGRSRYGAFADRGQRPGFGRRFVFGMTNSGELVNEKPASQISTVYACVRLLAETVASLPLHLYRFTDAGAGKGFPPSRGHRIFP